MGDSYYDSMRSEAKLSGSHLAHGVNKTLAAYGQKGGDPHTVKDVIVNAALAVPAGAKDFKQAAIHGGKAAYNAAGAFMEGTARQHGPSQSVTHNMALINQSIQSKGMSGSGNRGISSFRSKVSEQAGGAAQTGKTANLGISSFQNKVSGQSGGAKGSGTSGGAAKGAGASSGQSR